MSLDKSLNKLLVELYQSILDIEEETLVSGEFADVTINDMHVIEAIGDGKARTSSEVAKNLGITMGTLTKSIDGLVRKGYVQRSRSQEDKRVVLLSLLERGRAAFDHHAQFHKNMVESVVNQLDSNEAEVLEKSLGRLNMYFSTLSPKH